MRFERWRASLRMLLAALLLTGSSVATAQPTQGSWTTRPVRWVVAFAPGGPADVISRILAQGLAERIGQPVIVENRPGASGNLATEYVAKSAPDGSTLLFVVPNIITNLFFIKGTPDPFKDLAPIIHLDNAPMVLLVNNDLPAKSVGDLVSLIRAKPGAITCGSSGAMPTVGCELLRSRAGADILMVPYKGQAPAMTALASGEINVLFEVVNTATGQARAGRVRALASMAAKRGTPLFPDLPTAAESLPDFEVVTWHGVMAAKGTPRDLAARIYREIAAVLAQPEMRARLVESGLEIVAGPAEAFEEMLRRDHARFGKVLAAAGVKPE